MLRQQTNTKSVAIYCRLSKDDGTSTESMSIGTQKQILLDYVNSNGLGNALPYIDDGYSGKNFQRPAFQRMIEDIKKGKISTCVTKDLSRLGRNYIETGMYIEIFFPENDVRYIAIADGIDTNNNTASLDIAPFKNILNDMYLKDISKKVTMAKRTRFNQGKFMGAKAPFGYLKDPLDRNHLVIDERYVAIIKRVFALAKDGLGISKIRQILTDEKILRPSACDDDSNYDRFFEDNEDNRYTWSNNSVRSILRNPVYAGHLAGYKRQSKGFKSDKRTVVPFDEWEIIRNTHEAIINDEEYELVQKLLTSRKKSVAGTSGYENVFSGLIKCETCGYAMRTSKANRKPKNTPIDNIVYTCNNYATYGTKFCTHHKIEARELHNVILADINKHSQMAMVDTDALLQEIISTKELTSKEDIKRQKQELKQYKKRLAEVDNLFAKLFENNASGKISERNYLAMSQKYELEQAELENEIDKISQKLKDEEELNDNTDINANLWIDEIKKYVDIKKLTAPLLNSLIDKITISETTVLNGEKHQTVNIYYKFIGNIG